jgi:hypothetical protein
MGYAGVAEGEMDRLFPTMRRIIGEAHAGGGVGRASG